MLFTLWRLTWEVDLTDAETMTQQRKHRVKRIQGSGVVFLFLSLSRITNTLWSEEQKKYAFL